MLPLIGKDAGHGREGALALRRAAARLSVEYDETAQIGRRYRRQDEIGTPYGLTIDGQTLEDETVTVRDRDSLAQERIPIGGARAKVGEAARCRLEDAEVRLRASAT